MKSKLWKFLSVQWHEKNIFVLQLAEVQEDLLTQLRSVIEDDNKQTRLIACRVMTKVFNLAGNSLDHDRLHNMYPDLLKRMDDSSDDVRVAVAATFQSYFACFQNDYNVGLYKAHLEAIYRGLLVHLDDPEPRIQEAVLGKFPSVPPHQEFPDNVGRHFEMLSFNCSFLFSRKKTLRVTTSIIFAQNPYWSRPVCAHQCCWMRLKVFVWNTEVPFISTNWLISSKHCQRKTEWRNPRSKQVCTVTKERVQSTSSFINAPNFAKKRKTIWGLCNFMPCKQRTCKRKERINLNNSLWTKTCVHRATFWLALCKREKNRPKGPWGDLPETTYAPIITHCIHAFVYIFMARSHMTHITWFKYGYQG